MNILPVKNQSLLTSILPEGASICAYVNVGSRDVDIPKGIDMAFNRRAFAAVAKDMGLTPVEKIVSGWDLARLDEKAGRETSVPYPYNTARYQVFYA